MALRQIWTTFSHSLSTPGFSPASTRFFCQRRNYVFSKWPRYVVKVGIPEFLNAIGKGVEAHALKLETEIRDFNKLLFVRTRKLKKLGIPCKHRKLILSYANNYRLGLWRPVQTNKKIPVVKKKYPKKK